MFHSVDEPHESTGPSVAGTTLHADSSSQLADGGLATRSALCTMDLGAHPRGPSSRHCVFETGWGCLVVRTGSPVPALCSPGPVVRCCSDRTLLGCSLTRAGMMGGCPEPRDLGLAGSRCRSVQM